MSEMITDEQVRWIALFFLFSFMEESSALQAAQRVIAQVKASAPKDATSVSNISIIRALRKTWDQQKKSQSRNRTVVPPDHAWILPDHMDIGPWAKFQKEAASEQLLAVILSKVLKFSDQEIAEGLNISLGTARYRIGKGIRQLGLVTKSAGR